MRTTDTHCCTAMTLDERGRAALLGLVCTDAICASQQLATARPQLAVVEGSGGR